MTVGFTHLDWLVLIVYFVAITSFGLWQSRRVRSSGSYFLGDRQLPWWVMIGQAFGAGTHAENPVAQAGATCGSGFATIWYQWKNMLMTPFYWLLAPWYRRSRRTTIGEIIEDRYGPRMAAVYSLFAIAFFVLNQGTMFKGAGKIIAMASGGGISPNGVVAAMTAAVLLYSFFGGLVAAAYTDFIQGFLIIALSFMLIPAGLARVGGFAGMHALLPRHFFDLYNEASGVDAFGIAMLALNGLIGVTAMPHMLSLTATGRTERSGRIGNTYGTFLKRFCTIGWALTGLIVAAMLLRSGARLDDREQAFGYACLHLLGPGLTGLMVACVLAANMSACSNFIVNAGALFARNFYRPFLRPQAGDREILLAGRLSGLMLTLVGAGVALLIDKVLDAFLFSETAASFMGVMFAGGFLWRRANRQGAAASIVVSFLVYYAGNYLLSCAAAHGSSLDLAATLAQLPRLWRENAVAAFLASGMLRLLYPWNTGVFAAAMLGGCFSFVVVGLLGPAEDPRRLARFFDRMARNDDQEATPADETLADATGSGAVRSGRDLLLLDLPGWLRRERWRGFFQRYREDLLGFALAWLTVAVLIASAWGLMQIGA
jgi:Na+/proline symporter